MKAYRTGMNQLLASDDCDRLLAGDVGLVCHPASVNQQGLQSANLLRHRVGDRLRCLLGPEHGFWGSAGAGISVCDATHPEWGIPVYSLYGDVRPGLQALAEMDVVVIDLQDLAVRCYTYLHTLRQVLETVAKKSGRVIVTDRAVPWSRCIDGPMLDSAFRSVVAPIEVPLVYGMTPGETARWIVEALQLNVDLVVIPADYERTMTMTECWPTWVPPSPAIRSWQCAACFPVSVFTEALPHLDCARSTDWAFRILRADWLKTAAMIEALNSHQLPGMKCAIHKNEASGREEGIELQVLDVSTCQPIYASIVIVYELMRLHGSNQIWSVEGVRPDWFDKLMGTDQVREALLAQQSPDMIRAAWLPSIAEFRQLRQKHLLYAAGAEAC